MFVPKHFMMNPETDELFVDGHDLQNGMIVLLEDDNFRIPLTTTLMKMAEGSAEKTAAALRSLKYNQWVRVTKLRKTETTIAFVGVNDYDGHQALYRRGMVDAWYVKKETIDKVSEDFAKQNLENN